ncbi:hypothetical protein [Paracoccus shanxieyensis]|uniref:Uncharacterized protein n=1 Tax=Paracoccus shanxieyensis TaxID=2675752 RepID=A0A6L6J330_9RHOB|nr:hypothetical protein [Paracoccus shanxieyensis]MTH66301.1 hypothetical protein [Paracoccus shanxieyensis]MTH89090.1 hypothetical protein [Paracoccus shanxieyensis]
MFSYLPPGNLDDLVGRPSRQGFLDHWNRWVENQIRDEIRNLTNPKGLDRVPKPLFFTEADSPAQSSELPVTWNGYPLAISRQTAQDPPAGWAWLDELGSTDIYTPDGSNVVTTQFRRHDEYCEWRWDENGPRGSRIIFTAEGPEYWILLAEHDIDRVVSLYQELVSSDVRKGDLLLEVDLQYTTDWLLPAGTYNPFNKWNTKDGIIHLTHPANTLGAEINLAARATVLRRDARGARITESRRLIASSGYGSVNRSSDPNIGYGVNITAVPVNAKNALSITLANPVGLYMDEVAETRITDGNDQPLAGWFRFVRGTKGRGLMAVLEPPEGDPRTLSDVFVEGEPLRSGGQIAGLIQMVIYAATAALGMPMSPLQPPVYRACVAKGTDLSDLSKVNINPGWRPDQTCRQQGAAETPPIALDDAYPELFDAEAFIASGEQRGATRNV